MLATKEMMEEYVRIRERHMTHTEGARLFFYDQYCKKYRPGEVKFVHKHFMTVYYVLEVDTGPPIGDFYLHMVSAFNVKTREELEDDEIVEFYLETPAEGVPF